MTIVVNVDEQPLEQITKQLNKLVNVIKIVELEPSATVQRELLLVKVKADAVTSGPGAGDRPAVPCQGGRRDTGRDHDRGDRQPGEARGDAAGAGAVRRPRAGAVRHGRDRPGQPVHHRPHAAAGPGAASPHPNAAGGPPPTVRPATAPPGAGATARAPRRHPRAGAPDGVGETPHRNARRRSPSGSRNVLRRRRRPLGHPGPQRGRARLRQPGPRPRAVAARLRRRRPGRPARGLAGAGPRPRPRACAC